jgi:hypothetical protein
VRKIFHLLNAFPPRFRPLKPFSGFLARKQLIQPLARHQVTKARPEREFTASESYENGSICSEFAANVALQTSGPYLLDKRILAGYPPPAGHFLSPTMA